VQSVLKACRPTREGPAHWGLGKANATAVVNTPGQKDWSSKVTRIAVTTMTVAIAIYIAARLIESVAPILIICIGAGSVAYTLALATRHKRDRW